MISFALLKYTKTKVKRLFGRSSVLVHRFDHTARVAAYAAQIALKEKENERLAQMAAWLHDVGQAWRGRKNSLKLPHHEISYLMARDWLSRDRHFKDLSAKEKEEILYAVRYHWDDTADKYPSAVILRDADKLDLFGPAGLERVRYYNVGDEFNFRINLIVNLERLKRLKTKTARKIVKKENLLGPVRRALKWKGKPPRVLAAMSGGVDSAVAAALLIKAGYEVTGAFIKCYSHNTDDTDSTRMTRITQIDNNDSCWIEDRREAMRVAAKLGIKLLTFDFEKEYRRQVVDYLFREYRAGRTPNPDVICNKFIKFPLLLKEAKKRGFDYLATGHYARLWREIRNSKSLPAGRQGEIRNKSKIQNPKSKTESGYFKLLEAVDKNKDQSYFLHQLKQPWLKDILFPLGNLTKSEVRLLAKNMGLPVAERQESMGICFVGEVKMKEFLKKRINPRPGNIILSSGKAIGRHEGLAFYTIGQRQGLDLGGGIPYFVADKNFKRNQLVVACGRNIPSLFKKGCLVSEVNWIAGHPPKFPLKCEVRLRHRQELQKCVITQIHGFYADDADHADKFDKKIKSKIFKVIFKTPQRAVTPGQFAVFYKGGECLGGGEIGENF